jgi:hypothetical protein
MSKLVLSFAIVALPLSACTTPASTSSHAGTGAVVGAAAGAGLAAVTGRSVLAGAAVGAVAGAGAGVLLSEVDRSRPIEGDVREGVCTRPDAEEGRSVPGMTGATWADLDGDGCVDGYVYNGRYYKDAPQ